MLYKGCWLHRKTKENTWVSDLLRNIHLNLYLFILTFSELDYNYRKDLCN